MTVPSTPVEYKSISLVAAYAIITDANNFERERPVYVCIYSAQISFTVHHFDALKDEMYVVFSTVYKLVVQIGPVPS